jgi:pyrimidine deaminase RibD-like protein
MRLYEFEQSDYVIKNRDKLDHILLELCHHVIKGQQHDPIKYGMVAACVLDPENRKVFGVNEAAKDGTRRHAERVAMDRYVEHYGDIPEGSIILSTLSPCSDDMDERYGESCTDLVNDSNVRKVYCGYIDPTQHDTHEEYTLEETSNEKIISMCKKFADTFLKDMVKEAANLAQQAAIAIAKKEKQADENFADGKNPGRKGLAKRSGVNTKASVSSLRNTAKHSTGEKARMAHWLANMKAGRAKKNK